MSILSSTNLLSTTNPFKAYRDQLGLTQYEVSKRAGVTVQVVHKHEHGAINVISPRIATVFVDLLEGVTYVNLQEDYLTWRKALRQQVNLPPSLNKDTTIHPLLELLARNYPGVSNIALCKMLALHPAILVRYCLGRQASMPDSIEVCLRDVGWSVQEINNLKEAGVNYYKWAKAAVGW